MTPGRLVWRGLRFYWRTHLAVALGVAVSAAVIVGALAVGDSVRHSLQMMALARLGKVELALAPPGRFFRAKLADDLESGLKATVAPALVVRGVAVSNGGGARANQVQVVGVEERFWTLGGTAPLFSGKTPDEVVVNERLAGQLGLRAGDELLLRIEKPSLLGRDAPLSTEEDTYVALNLTVGAVATDADFGRFSLQANQIPPYNAFVPLATLQKATELKDSANALLVGDTKGGPLILAGADAVLGQKWQLADANVQLREVPGQGAMELRSDRVFLDPPVAQAALGAAPEARGVLTYFVNGLHAGGQVTPYSMVTAAGSPLVPSAMRDDEVIINEWLANDLRVKPGEMLTLRYFISRRMRKLEEKSARFRIRAVVPLRGVWADRALLPAFPGIAEAENSSDWEPGINIDLGKIRPKDEDYWDRYRGTPKAFITLKAGQRMWANRFGDLTAIRYAMPRATAETVTAGLKQSFDPATIGLSFIPVREQALAASAQAMNFGHLFLGFSFFLIVAALLLTALLFALGIEQRGEEVGTLLGLGFTPVRVRRLFMLEAAVLAFFGSVIGAGLGVFYTRAVLYGLSTIWQGAVGTSDLRPYIQPSSIAGGLIASVIAALLTIWLVARRQATRPARELLTGSGAEQEGGRPGDRAIMRRGTPRGGAALITGGIAATAALGLLLLAASSSSANQATLCFIAGALLLIGTLTLCHALLSPSATLPHSQSSTQLTLGTLGWRNSTRRRGRSVATMSLLACASFLIIAVGANRHDPAAGVEQRSSGTGGFALYGESTLPLYQDLNSDAGRQAYGLDSLTDIEFVPLRVHEGDDASCLNLNRAQTPRLLGVRPEDLQARGAFTFAGTVKGTEKSWLLLHDKGSENTVPAIGDQATVVWGLGKSVGDTLTYSDERGKQFQVRIVGLVAKSILQGSLLIAEDAFIERFPSESGYRSFLIDAPAKRAAQTSRTLSQAMEDVGLEVTPAVRRLAAFNAVENTYLSIFGALGGLGLLLGSVGLGLVVLRNVLERRGELALLTAVGFPRRALHWLVFSEHVILVLLGLGCGVTAALVAVLPALRSPGAQVPVASLAMTLGAVLLSGALWTWLATALSLRGHMIHALRNE